MSIWGMWLDTLRASLDVLTSDVGFGLGAAVIVLTILLRATLVPISWTMAYRNCVRQKKMKHMQPALEELRARLAHKPETYTRELIALHKSHGLSLIDGRSLLGALVQIPVFVGMFHVLRGIGEGVRFLWASNLIRPDTFLAVIAGVTTALMIAANPDMPEQTRLLIILIPSIIAVMTALHFSSALALYWTTSNVFSMVQTLTLHWVVNRQIRKGALRI